MMQPDGAMGVARAAACALGIASAPTGLGIAAAIATCLILFYPAD